MIAAGTLPGESFSEQPRDQMLSEEAHEMPSPDAFASMVSDLIGEGLLILSEDLTIERVNATFSKSFGVKEADLVGHHLYEVMEGQWDIPPVRKLLEERLGETKIATGVEFEYEFDVSGPRRLLINARRFDEQPWVLLVVDDRTEQEGRANPLHHRKLEAPGEALLERILRDLPDLVAVHDVQTHANLWCNAHVLEVLGYRPEEVYDLGSALLPFLVHPADMKRVHAFYAGYEQENGHDPVRQITCRMMRKDGSYRWIATRETVFQRDEDGRIRQILIVARDVTEQRRTELERDRLLTEIEQERRHLKDVLDHIPVAVLLAEENGRIIYWNPHIEALLQQPFIPAESTEDYADWPIFRPDSEEPFPVEERPLVRALREAEAMHDVEMRFQRPDGSWCEVLASGTPIFDADGNIALAVGSFLDISRRKRAERGLRELTATLEERVARRTSALKESEERFRALIEASAQIVWTTDSTGAAVDVSPSWGAFTGQSYQEGKGWGWLKMVHPDDRDYVEKTWKQSIEEETPVDAEYRLYHADSDTWRWMHVRAVPLRREGGSVRGWVGMNTDIDKRRRAEQEQRRLNRVLQEQAEQIRALASQLTMAEQQERRRVAHILHDDLQQRLFGVQMKMRGIRKHAEADEREQLLENLEEVEAWLRRSIAITRQLTVDLSPPVLREDGLADAIRWLIAQMEDMHGLEVELKAAHAFRMKNEDMRVLLFQTVRELLFNVVKHAGVDRATVELQETEDEIVIHVIDEGRGFETERIAASEAREPGFGLFSARERIRLFGGNIDVTSQPGQGTRVTVRVPIERTR